MPNTHRWRRRDATVELSRVGIGGVYRALVSQTIRPRAASKAYLN